MEHSHYNACKDGTPGVTCTDDQTYHWHGVGFDGPVLPTERSYQVQEPLTPTTEGTIPAVVYSYPSTSQSFTLQNVDLSNSVSASLTLTHWSDGGKTTSFQYRVNGKSWHTFDNTHMGAGGSGWFYAVTNIPLNELVSGANTLELQNAVNIQKYANIDLLVEPSVVAPPPPSMTPARPKGLRVR